MTRTIVWSCVVVICLQLYASFADAYSNVARARPSLQRDTYATMVASFANDGDAKTSSCTTMCCVQSWWAVELAYPVRVTGVKVINDHNDYFAYRLNNFIVALSNVRPTPNQALPPNSYVRCGQYGGSVASGGAAAVTCSANQDAYQYVIILSSLTSADAVCLSEVEVYIDGRANWARNRRSFQLDNYYSMVASKANDGSTATSSCTTMCCAQPWWAVELDFPLTVTSVRVTNDNNAAFAYRLNDFIVGLSNTPPQVGQALSPNSYTRCGQYSGSLAALASAEVKCAPDLSPFKYVIIQTKWLTGDAICLAEVEVFSEDNPCLNNPCKNSGTCTATSPTTFTCACAPGWRGNDCSEEADPCSVGPCKNGGTCTKTSSTSFTCACVPGWKGDDCTTEVNVCAKENPCKNGGSCVKFGDSYQCRCSSNWAGTNCEMGSAACKGTDPTKRVNCGWGGVSADQCNKQSCCYDESIKNRPACFYTSFECDALKASERVNCGWEGISYVQCINRGCCFDDDEETNPSGPVCFRKANPACVGVKAVNRVARGKPGIQPNECNFNGWCFDSSISQSEGPWCFERV